MKIGLIQDKIGNESYSQKWAHFLTEYGYKYKELSLNPNSLNQYIDIDGVMWRFAHTPLQKRAFHILNNYLEIILKKTMYPDNTSAWHFDEKIAQHFLFETTDLACIKSYLFFNYQESMDWIAGNISYPLVHKLSTGAGSANILLVKNKQEAEMISFKMFFEGIYPYSFNEFKKKISLSDRIINAKKYFFKGIPTLDYTYFNIERGYLYFQKFLPNNSFDTRITVIGNRAFGFRRFNRENDFRASGSGKIDHEPRNIDLRCVEIAFKFSKQHNFKCMAYDFLFNELLSPEICEISYAFADKPVYECPGHWDDNLEWHEGKMWPEEAQVLDFISIIDKTISQK